MSNTEPPAKAAAAGEPSSPLALEFWPAEQPLGFLEAMNGHGGALADWLAQPEAPPVSAPPPGIPHGGGGSSSQLHQQQLLHSLQPMLGMQPGGADVVSAAACSDTGVALSTDGYHTRLLPVAIPRIATVCHLPSFKLTTICVAHALCCSSSAAALALGPLTA